MHVPSARRLRSTSPRRRTKNEPNSTCVLAITAPWSARVYAVARETRAASSRPVHESAVLCLHGSQSHRWHVVRRTHHHPRHHQSTQGYRCGLDDRTHVHISAPNKQEAPTQRRGGQGMTRQIASVAAPRHISLIYMHTLREYPAGQHPELDTSLTH